VSIYADSSFFVSLYITDSHTPEVLRLLSRHPRVWFTPFHEAEISHAIAQNVFRERITQDDAARTYERLSRHLSSDVWALTGFPEATFTRAATLARTHVAKPGTRTLDSLHVAAALELKAERFWTFDDRQAKLAKAAGLKVT
jgi:predicted nucleic acid-binding protein